MLDPFVVLAPILVLPIVGLLRFIGCAQIVGLGNFNYANVTVTVKPPTSKLCAGQSQSFNATVQGAPPGVTWSSSAPGLIGNMYTAPTPVLAQTTVTITATANSNMSSKGTATITLVPASANFVSADTATAGGWNGSYYGGDVWAWALAATPADNAQFSDLVDLKNIVWTPPVTAVYEFAAPGALDPRCLLIPPQFAQRFLCAWFGPVVQIDFSFPDAAAHRVAIYFCDFDGMGRSQTVDLLDASQSPPQKLTPTKPLTTFGQGVYLVYDVVCGARLQVTSTAGPNAVVNGIFFGPAE